MAFSAEKWERVRAAGRARFVLVYGVVGWGVTVAVLYSLVSYFLLDQSFWRALIISLVLFPIGGYWLGKQWWDVNEKKYGGRD
jgi:Na+-driven multidrug efflux pump